MTQLTLGSLFDGIGGFPLAGIYAGMKPVWASEIEPFPIRVTTKRLPFMKHLGDIHRVNGGKIDPVDVIAFGSPCQNWSVAGKRTGLAGEQSSLFFEAVRVITEMRDKTNGTHPRWVVWENVPGALSSAGCGDFRSVLESLVRVKDREAAIPMPKDKWLSAGEIMGDGYSLAWRILDASKGWGVAQRRRRVFAVLDLDGASAGKVLFESEGLSGYTPPCVEARKRAAGGAEAGAGASGITKHNSNLTVEFNPTDNRIRIKEDGICQTLTNRMGTGGNQVPLTVKIRSGGESGGEGVIRQGNTSSTLGCKNDQAPFAPKAYGISSDQSNAMLSDNPHSGVYEADTSRTLDCSGTSPVCNQGGIAVVEPVAFAQDRRNEARGPGNAADTVSTNSGMKQKTFVAAFMGGQGSKAGGLGYQEEISPTLKATPSGGNTVPDVVYALQGNLIGRKDGNGPQGTGVNEEVCFTLNTIDRPAVAAPAYSVRPFVNTEVQEEQTPSLMARDDRDALLVGQPSYCMTVGSYGRVAEEKTPTLEARGYKDPPVIGKSQETMTDYIVRRLTPGECCRLQGYPDGWTEDLDTEAPTDEEVRWWAGVFEEWRNAQGKSARPRSRNQIVKWLKNPRTDGAEYKAYGNSVATPCVFFVLAGIVWAEETEAVTLEGN